MKRLFLIILAAVMLASCFSFVGCTGEGEEMTAETDEVTEETTLPETEAPSLDAVIFDENGLNFKIIRSTYADNVEVNAAVTLNNAIREKYYGDIKTTIGDDFVKGQTRDDVFEIEGNEILVGKTNRKETDDVYKTLSKDEYVIKVSGTKLVIVGKDAYATSCAVEYFVQNLLSESDGKTFVLTQGLEYKGKASLRKVSVHKESQYRIMTWNLGCMVSDSKNGQKECIEIITRYLPDIMGLQECNSAVYSKVLSQLPKFYAHAIRNHPGSNVVNYTPIIYNTELFELLDADVQWLRGRYTGTNTKSISYAVFEDTGGVKFALINYHGAVCSNNYKGFENFTSEQLNQQALTWRLDNVVQVTEIKNSIVAKYGNIPIMVSGDNNFNSTSQPYKNITAEGFLDAEHTARIEKTTGYKTSFSYGTVPGEGLSIDHIFGLNGVDFVSHNIVRGDDVYKASDHCPVYVDFNPLKP